MVWSLSKDDDGLDSVLPLADDSNVSAPAPTPQAHPVHGARVSVRQSERPTARPAGGPPSIVVDPGSQVPETHAGSHGRRGSVEATLVLKGRKLDHLRAEVARHRMVHQRKKQRALLLWAGAGGLALCLGWGAGIAFGPSDSIAPGGDEAALDGPSAESTGAVSPRALPTDTEPSAAAQKPSVEPSVAPVEEVVDEGTIRLEDLPEQSEDEELDEAADSASEQPAEEPAAFTLDDLPTD